LRASRSREPAVTLVNGILKRACSACLLAGYLGDNGVRPKEDDMKKNFLLAAAIAAGVAFAPVAFAADDMKKDTMAKDKMEKKDSMAKDKMKKEDAMMKKDGMAKDKMKH
jgi:pentapeptide MXKDX repeat protein